MFDLVLFPNYPLGKTIQTGTASMKAFITSSVTRFMTIGSFVTLFMDLAQPIFPFAMTTTVGFLGLSLLLFVLQSVPGVVREHAKSALPFTLIMIALSFGTWMLQNSIEDDTDKGVLASTFPAFNKMQSQMADLVKTNERIADATENISLTSSRTANATEELADTVKKETSDDPRKELLNIGLPWGDQNFWKALDLNDARALSLFIQAGLPVENSEIWEYALVGEVSIKGARTLAAVGFSLTDKDCDLSEFKSPAYVDTIKYQKSVGRDARWSEAGGHYNVFQLTTTDTAGSLSQLCDHQHLRNEIEEVVRTGLNYPNVYEETRIKLVNECEVETAMTSFENYVAVVTDGYIEIPSDFIFTDYDDSPVIPDFPERDLTISELIVQGTSHIRAIDSVRDGYKGMAIRRMDKKVNDTTWFGYKNRLKRVCTTIAYPELDTGNRRLYEKIRKNFSSILQLSHPG